MLSVADDSKDKWWHKRREVISNEFFFGGKKMVESFSLHKQTEEKKIQVGGWQLSEKLISECIYFSLMFFPY